MTKEEYATVQQQVILLGNLLAEADLAGAIALIERSETIDGLFVAPAAYSAALPRMEAYRECLRALQQFQKKYERFKEVVAETEPTVAQVRHLVPGVGRDVL